MKAVLILCLFICLGLAVRFQRPPGIPINYRLIQTNENTTKWMNPSEIVEQECGKEHKEHSGFMDITDFPLIDKRTVPAPAPLPSVCSYQSTIVDNLVKQININEWIGFVEALSKIPNRYYADNNGVLGAQMVFKWIEEMCRENCAPQFFPNTFLQPNVVFTIKGESDERVILGAHIDSIASPNWRTAPGADDDASGTSVLLEVIRVLLANQYKPKRTLEFQFYAAEEVGLRGSLAIADKYAAENVNVYAMIQFDMVGYSKTNPIFITDNVNPELTRCLRDLTKQLNHPTWGSSTCGYGCSDHASFTRVGYRSSFPFECSFASYNPYIHTTSDTLNKLNPDHARYFIELGVAAAVSLTSQ